MMRRLSPPLHKPDSHNWFVRLTPILAFAGIIVLGGFLTLFFLAPRLIHSLQLETRIKKQIEEQTGLRPSFESIKLTFTPFPAVEIHRLSFVNPKTNRVISQFQAEFVRIEPQLLAFVFKRLEFAQVLIEGAQCNYLWHAGNGVRSRVFSIRDLNLKLRNVGSGRPISFNLEGKWLSTKKNLAASGTIQTDFSNFDFRTLDLNSQFSVKQIPVSELVNWWGGELPIFVKQGTLEFHGSAFKKKSSVLEARGAANLENFSYEIPGRKASGSPARYQLEFGLEYDVATGALHLKDGKGLLPFGDPVVFEANLNTQTWDVKQILIHSDSVRLESLFQHLLPLQEALPVNMGFSGNAKFNFYAKGNPAHLFFSLSTDLTDAALSYSTLFSKPEHVPLSIQADLQLAGGRVWRGDLTTEFEGASLKGSVVAFDQVSHLGEVTVLTNKFRTNQWEQYFPFLKGFKPAGQFKILASVKGDLSHLEKTEMMANLTFDQFSLSTDQIDLIKDLNGSIDFGPIDSELSNLQFKIGESVFFIEGKMFRNPSSRTLIGMRSESVNLEGLFNRWEALCKVLKSKGIEAGEPLLEAIRTAPVDLPQTIEQLKAQIVTDKGRVIIPELSFQADQGTMQLKGLFDLTAHARGQHLEAEFARLNLARLRKSGAHPLLDGNLFGQMQFDLEGAFDKSWLEHLSGSGTFSVTNGEFHAVDLLAGLGKIRELAVLTGFGSGTTRFSDANGKIILKNQKLNIEDLLIISNDFHVSGKGEVAFDESIDFRLSAFLSPVMSQKIISDISENARLGPIPIVVLGTLSKPSVRTDPMLIGTFLEKLMKHQLFGITSQMIPKLPKFQSQESQKTSGKEKNSSTEKTASEQLQDALVSSGFNLLDQFLSSKKTSS